MKNRTVTILLIIFGLSCATVNIVDICIENDKPEITVPRNIQPEDYFMLESNGYKVKLEE